MKTDPPDARLETQRGPRRTRTRRAASAAACRGRLGGPARPRPRGMMPPSSTPTPRRCSATALSCATSPTPASRPPTAATASTTPRAGLEAAALAHEIDTAGTAWRQAQAVMQHAPPLDERTARAYEQARESFDAAINDLTARLVDRSTAINAQRAQIAKDIYYEELARERAWRRLVHAGQRRETLPAQTGPCSPPPRASTPTRWLSAPPHWGRCWPNAPRRAPTTPPLRCRSRRRSRAEVFDLHDALDRGYLRRRPLRGVRAGHGRRGGIGARAHQRGVDAARIAAPITNAAWP